MSEIFSYYDRWEQRWELVNPPPTRETIEDVFQVVLLVLVVVGAVVLSGTRTGAAVAEIGAFRRFAVLLGVDSPLFHAFDGILAFLAFDAAVLLAGYLLEDDRWRVNWFVVLFVASMTTVLAANLLPATRHNEQLARIASVTVDVIVGVTTPLMSFVGGSVARNVRRKRKEEYNRLLTEYESRKRNAWTSSPEYKEWRRDNVTIETARQPKKRREEAPRLTLNELVRESGGRIAVADAQRVLRLSRSAVLAQTIADPDLEAHRGFIELPDF